MLATAARPARAKAVPATAKASASAVIRVRTLACGMLTLTASGKLFSSEDNEGSTLLPEVNTASAGTGIAAVCSVQLESFFPVNMHRSFNKSKRIPGERARKPDPPSDSEGAVGAFKGSDDGWRELGDKSTLM